MQDEQKSYTVKVTIKGVMPLLLNQWLYRCFDGEWHEERLGGVPLQLPMRGVGDPKRLRLDRGCDKCKKKFPDPEQARWVRKGLGCMGKFPICEDCWKEVSVKQ
jgi:hypothetical protein